MKKVIIPNFKCVVYIILIASFIILSCTEDQPIIIEEQNWGTIAGTIKPSGIVASIKIYQGVLKDSTYSDSLSGYFEFDSLQIGFYTMEVTAKSFGTYRENKVQVIKDGITSVGTINLKQIPEQLTAIVPPNGSQNIQLMSPCGFEFSTYMNHSSVENNFHISPSVDGYYDWIENGTTNAFLFYPRNRYQTETKYTFVLNTAAQTIYGDTLSFQVSSVFYTEPVKIESYFPENGANHISPGVSIYVKFNSPMNQTSVESALQILNSVSGAYIWHNDESFSFNPDHFLATNTQYKINITTSASDKNNHSLFQPFSTVFTTEPLRITYTYPSNGASNVDINSTIQIQFNTHVKQAASEDAFSITPSVTGTFSWTDFSKFTFYPDSPLNTSTMYIITINTSCTDLYDSQLLTEYSFSFETQSD